MPGPQPSYDDPKQLATAPLHLVLQLVLFSLDVAIPLVVVFATWNWRKVVSDWLYRVRIAVFGVGVATFWILTHYDPEGYGIGFSIKQNEGQRSTREVIPLARIYKRRSGFAQIPRRDGCRNLKAERTYVAS
jgi:hypothetical protein